MIKRIIAFLLTICILSGISVYAMPSDLWEYDSRFENIYGLENVEKSFDVIQKLIDYIGIANKEDISGEDKIKPAVLIRAIAKIVGLEYDDSVDTLKIFNDLKSAKYIRESASMSNITLQEVLYAGTRITGWTNQYSDLSTVLEQARKSGLTRNITNDLGKILTKSETAQFIYNLISVNTKKEASYSNNGYIKLEKNVYEPIIESKYGITLKRGVVTSVYGESIFNRNIINEDEIEIDGKTYRFNTTESRSALAGKDVVCFVNIEDEYVIFVEATTDNNVEVINYGTDVFFNSDFMEYETETGEHEIQFDSRTVIVYNGVSVGTYSPDLMKKYFTKASEITAIDNNDDYIYDVISIREWKSYVVAYQPSLDGTIMFDYGAKLDGISSIDASPDNKNTHVIVQKDGEPFDYTQIKAGDVISISASANKTGNKYYLIEAGYENKTGVLEAASGDIYVVDGVEYIVSENLIQAQNTNADVYTPIMGEEYVFYIDAAGQIAHVDVPKDIKFGYIVKISMGRGMDAVCEMKILTEESKIITVKPAKKVIVHSGNNYQGYTCKTSTELIDRIITEAKARAGGELNYNGDYRSIIQYKLKNSDEISEIWLPMDNTSASSFGTSGYSLTKDVNEASGMTYYGVMMYKSKLYRTPAEAPIFNIPADLDADEDLYFVSFFNQYQYNVFYNQIYELYSIDEYRMIGAAVVSNSEGANEISSYNGIFIVDKVTSAINEEKEVIYKAYGWMDGVYSSIMSDDDELTSDADSGWEVVNFKDLKFGDLIQFNQSESGYVTKLKVVFRASNIGADRLQFAVNGSVNEGIYDGAITSYGNFNQMFVAIGSYYDRKQNALRMNQNGDLNPYYLHTRETIGAYIIDVAAKKLQPTSVEALRQGDKVMFRGTWGAIDDIYIVR